MANRNNTNTNESGGCLVAFLVAALVFSNVKNVIDVVKLGHKGIQKIKSKKAKKEKNGIKVEVYDDDEYIDDFDDMDFFDDEEDEDFTEV